MGQVGNFYKHPPPTTAPPPSQSVSPHFTTEPLFFCCFPIFSSLEPSKSPPKDKQDFSRWASSELFIKNCFLHLNLSSKTRKVHPLRMALRPSHPPKQVQENMNAVPFLSLNLPQYQ